MNTGKSQKIFYGWLIVAMGFILMSIGWGIVYNTASLFLGPISEDYGFTRTQISYTMTLRALTQTLMALFAGKIYRKIPIESSMKVMSLVLAGSYFLLSTSSQLWQFYLFSITSSLANSFLGLVPLSLVISNWFVEKRGSALGFAFMGSGFGGMIFSSLAGRWIVQYGWARTYQILAIIMLVCTVPIVFFFMKENPQKLGLRPYGEKEESFSVKKGIAFKEALSMPYFWFLGLISFSTAVCLHIVMISVAPHLTEIGYDFTFAANILALVMGGIAIGKLVLGYLFDRFSLRVAISLAAFGTLVGLVGLYFGYLFFILPLMIVGSGVGCAYGTIADPMISRSVFGEKDYASIYGVYAALASLGGVVAPVLHGRSYDRTGSYQGILLQAAILIFGILLVNQWIFSEKTINKYRNLWTS